MLDLTFTLLKACKNDQNAPVRIRPSKNYEKITINLEKSNKWLPHVGSHFYIIKNRKNNQNAPVRSGWPDRSEW